jgi:hypothetical protein
LSKKFWEDPFLIALVEKSDRADSEQPSNWVPLGGLQSLYESRTELFEAASALSLPRIRPITG